MKNLTISLALVLIAAVLLFAGLHEAGTQEDAFAGAIYAGLFAAVPAVHRSLE